MPITLFTADDIPVIGEPEEDYARHAQNFAYKMQLNAAEHNALADSVNASTTCTSSTSNNLTAGLKTFTVPAGLGFVPNMPVRCGNTASPGNYADAYVNTYSGVTLQVTFSAPVGSGSGITTWTIFKLTSASNVASLTNNIFTGTQTFAEGAAVASAATVNLFALTDGNTRALTGTTNINAWTIQNGAVHNLIYTGAGLTLNYSASTNRLNSGGTNLTLATNDRLVVSAGAGFVSVLVYKDSGVSAVSPIISSKIQPLTAVITTNTLVATFAPTTLDFRSTTLTSGAVTSITNASLNITAATTASLGLTTAVQGRIAVLEVNNAGTPVLCYVNLLGGLQLDETKLISPSTIGAGSTSANTIYSASAVGTNLAFRVVGYIDATWTSGTGWALSQVQGEGGQSSFYNVPSSRAYYESGEVAIPAVNTTASGSHGFGVVPVDYKVYLKCTTAEFGYAVGDIIDITSTNDGDGARFVGTFATTTIVGIQLAVTINIKRRDAAGGTLITNASWRLVFKAWL